MMGCQRLQVARRPLLSAAVAGVLSVATFFSISSNHFDKIRQFLPGIEIDPFAGRIQIGQALIFFALNPYQILVS